MELAFEGEVSTNRRFPLCRSVVVLGNGRKGPVEVQGRRMLLTVGVFTVVCGGHVAVMTL
ncbi:hypothetical protein IGI04_030976 [Brassica rapa subsp. trilocularis]|uniref:Uncharacterized protein n=1 Tax=Brassica rapa subsp. trilocularis TaxID=1813537 RepID=A0ABQ7LTV2_BRACM|nr:hypothetical protein IGI04_030976 [Brassica rapa subsp. trilocularis]